MKTFDSFPHSRITDAELLCNGKVLECALLSKLHCKTLLSSRLPIFFKIGIFRMKFRKKFDLWQIRTFTISFSNASHKFLWATNALLLMQDLIPFSCQLIFGKDTNKDIVWSFFFIIQFVFVCDDSMTVFSLRNH